MKGNLADRLARAVRMHGHETVGPPGYPSGYTVSSAFQSSNGQHVAFRSLSSRLVGLTRGRIQSHQRTLPLLMFEIGLPKTINAWGLARPTLTKSRHGFIRRRPSCERI
jgi:hypothetical protein